MCKRTGAPSRRLNLEVWISYVFCHTYSKVLMQFASISYIWNFGEPHLKSEVCRFCTQAFCHICLKVSEQVFKQFVLTQYPSYIQDMFCRLMLALHSVPVLCVQVCLVSLSVWLYFYSVANHGLGKQVSKRPSARVASTSLSLFERHRRETFFRLSIQACISSLGLMTYWYW